MTGEDVPGFSSVLEQMTMAVCNILWGSIGMERDRCRVEINLGFASESEILDKLPALEAKALANIQIW